MIADPLSDLLQTVRLTGAVFFEIAAQEPWAIGSPPRERILPRILPGADHLIAYHAVTAGRCFATVRGGKAIPLNAGQVVVFTNGQPHVVSSGPDMRAEPPTADVLEVAAAGEQPFLINCGDGTPSAKLVCGYLACDARPFNPLLENLPPIMVAGDSRGDGTNRIAQFIQYAAVESAEKRSGSESILTKLSEVMFIDVVRQHLEGLPSEQAGWLAGLRDPFVGRALSLIHGKPSFDWTIEELARQIGSSRSVLAERFTQVVGIPPMQYLGKWRMQIASELLTGSNMTLANIAAKVGYQSEAAFSRAFKKTIGENPSSRRRR